MLAALFSLLLAAVVVGLLYNTLVSKRNQVENAFASVDVLLKKRHDLIPNLVSTVKGYVKHERAVLTEVTELRAKAVSGELSPDDKTTVENAITEALKSLFMVVENYPDLKANKNFMHLQRSLNEVEEQISAARRAYNASVLDYNNAVQMFPTNVLASLMNFKPRKWFEVVGEEGVNVSVRESLKQ